MKALILAITCASLSSCAGVLSSEVRSPITGVVYDEDGPHIDNKTVSILFGKITRLVAGEGFDDVILDPFTK